MPLKQGTRMLLMCVGVPWMAFGFARLEYVVTGDVWGSRSPLFLCLGMAAIGLGVIGRLRLNVTGWVAVAIPLVAALPLAVVVVSGVVYPAAFIAFGVFGYSVMVSGGWLLAHRWARDRRLFFSGE